MTKSPLSGWQKIAHFFVVFALSACGAGAGVTGGGGGLPGSGDATGTEGSWLSGSWKGNYKAKDQDPGSALRETTAEATFKETESLAGEFSLKLPALENVAVTGTYHDFQGKSLLLDIKESNLSTVGSPKSSAEMTYSLVGNALELSNDRITIRLVRSSGAGDEQKPDDGKKKDVVIDDWLCKDNQALNWKFKISEASFTLDVFDSTGTREGVWMKGDVKITRGTTDADAVLTVTSSGQKDKYKGLELRANTMGDNLMNLRRMIESNGQMSVAEIMSCNTI